MSDIFISYARGDRAQAEKLAHALKAEGWLVWWDPVIPAGKTFDEVIEQALEKTRCVVVVWSKESVASRWVRTEAAEGANRQILIPILIDCVQIPLAFRRIQAANMIGWNGTRTAKSFQKLVADIVSLIGPGERQLEHKQTENTEVKGRNENQKRMGDEAEARQKAKDYKLEKQRKRPAPQKVDTRQKTDTSSPYSLTPLATTIERRRGTLVGAIVGALLGAITIMATYSSDWYQVFSGAVPAGLGGAIIGAICRKQGKVVVIALVGVVLGFGVWVMVDTGDFGNTRAGVLGAPIGGIFGAIVGAIVADVTAK